MLPVVRKGEQTEIDPQGHSNAHRSLLRLQLDSLWALVSLVHVVVFKKHNMTTWQGRDLLTHRTVEGTG